MKTETPLEPAAPVPQRGGRARWMVVDDNEALLNLVAIQLEGMGLADVERCRSGAEALAAFNATPERFQFVITDLNMPGMNGIELCRRLREVSPDLKIVLATGSGVADEAGAQECGFCGLLAKPFPAAALRRVVESAGLLERTTPCANN